VVSTTGNVRNADALVANHEGYTTLTMVQGGTAPMIILDYGRDVGGIPIFEVSVVTGTPKLQAIYSESQQYLLPAGDGNSPAGVSFVGDCGAGDLARADTYSQVFSAYHIERSNLPHKKGANPVWTYCGPMAEDSPRVALGNQRAKRYQR
jgi:hypothetical protein